MKNFTVTGMSCSACSARVEKAVSEVPGVEYVSVNLLTNSMVTEGTAEDGEIIKAVIRAGYGAELSDKNIKNIENTYKKEAKTRLFELIFSLCLLVPLMYLGMGHDMLGLPLPRLFEEYHLTDPILQCVLCLAVMVINKRFFISGVKGVIRLSPNMDTLVSLGSSVSFIYSAVVMIMHASGQMSGMAEYYFESAAMILVFVSFGKFLESKAKSRTTDALSSLAKLAPSYANVIRDGKEVRIPAEQIIPGDIFTVRPGERFPADGHIKEGISSADESAFTGESIPREKEPGDKVYTATVNLSGFLKCEAEKTGSDTALAGIIKVAQETAATKAPVARMADRISSVLVPVVIGIALVTFVVWMFIKGEFSYALEKAVAVLVITCPCSLGLATPVAITVSGGIGARCGILFKNAEAIETLSSVDTIVLDKTGTVTKGLPEVKSFFCDTCEDACADRKEALSLAYSLEYKSEHPLGKAIVNYGTKSGCALYDSEDFKIYPGNGLSANIGDRIIRGGSLKYISSQTELSEEIRERSLSLGEKGETPLIFTSDGKFLCMFGVSDTIKEGTAETVGKICAMGIRPIMLSGDNGKTTAAVANAAGISTYSGEMMPEGKAAYITDLIKNGSKVAMAGDGINDAPALMAADVGMAIGQGADIAVDSANVVLMKSRAEDILLAIQISVKTMRNIKQNLFWAFFYNLLCIPLAAGVFVSFGLSLSPMICALCMSISSITVVMNSLRLNYIFRKELSESTLSSENKNKKEKNKMKKENENVVDIKISGMMCSHCEARVKNALESLPFVISADVSHKKGTAKVKVAEAGHGAEIKDAVTSAGYEVL